MESTKYEMKLDLPVVYQCNLIWAFVSKVQHGPITLSKVATQNISSSQKTKMTEEQQDLHF